jgi:hypothetical protein
MGRQNTTNVDTNRLRGPGSSNPTDLAATFPQSPVYKANGVGVPAVGDATLVLGSTAEVKIDKDSGASVNKWYFENVLGGAGDGSANAATILAGTNQNIDFSTGVDMNFFYPLNKGEVTDKSGKIINSGESVKNLAGPAGAFVPNVQVGQEPMTGNHAAERYNKTSNNQNAKSGDKATLRGIKESSGNMGGSLTAGGSGFGSSS